MTARRFRKPLSESHFPEAIVLPSAVGAGIPLTDILLTDILLNGDPAAVRAGSRLNGKSRL